MGLIKLLPPPPSHKKGWPWTEESPDLMSTMPNGENWPKISIVTPSFNQGEFIEETIRSVLLQNYPNLEYIIIDGGSTDNSVSIIKKYEPWLKYWVSKKDNGQSFAINKGFEKSTGEILNWLCSDDIFLPKTLENVSTRLTVKSPSWIIGSAFIINKTSRVINKNIVSNKITLSTFLRWSSNYFYQPSTFWNREIFLLFKGINNHLHYCMDVDLWFKFYKITNPVITAIPLSSARSHEKSKTASEEQSYYFIQELSEWILFNIFLKNKNDINDELFEGVKNIQYDLKTLNKLKRHIIFGKLLKFWKKFINKNII